VNTLQLAIRTALAGAILLASSAHARDGDLDRRFGTNGTTIVDFGATATAFGLALAPDGRIVLGGTFDDGGASGTDFAVARLTRDGVPDPDFSVDGKTTLAVGSGRAYDFSTNTIVQADGKIVVIGEGPDTDTVADDSDFKLARFNLDGSLDTSFSGDGKAYVAFDLGGDNGDSAVDGVQLPNGKLIVVGSAEVADDDTDFAVVRLNVDGSRDTSFDSDGRVTFSFDLDPAFPDEIATSVALDADGNILIVGVAEKGGSVQYDFAIARLTPNGVLDPNFGGDGRVTVAFDLGDTLNDVPLEVNLAPDGSIFVSGYTRDSGFDFGVVKLQPDGTPDPAFGTAGKATVAFDLDGDNDDIAEGAMLQPDGKLVFTGFAGDANTDIALARLDVDGMLDPTFGFAGKQLIALDLGGDLFDGALRGRFQDGYLVFGGVAANDAGIASFLAGRVIVDTLFEDGFD
jgi:uncharacterized delta-60 repeat protein